MRIGRCGQIIPRPGAAVCRAKYIATLLGAVIWQRFIATPDCAYRPFKPGKPSLLTHGWDREMNGTATP
jgi:hypothetical protein